MECSCQMSYRLENKRRDRLYGKPDVDVVVDTTELADKVGGNLDD